MGIERFPLTLFDCYFSLGLEEIISRELITELIISFEMAAPCLSD